MKTIVVDADKCYACLACVVECSYRRTDTPANAPLTAQNTAQSACEVEAVGADPVPLVCHHCEDAPCMTVCPTRALHRDGTGPVLLDAPRCIGCKACVMACPFGMVRMRADGKAVIKCDLCADRVARGLAPACVAACPSNAIEFKELDEVVLAARKRAAAAVKGI